MFWCLGLVVGLVALVALAVFAFTLVEQKRARETLAARGAQLGTWAVYYDVKTLRIGLIATFGERELLRYLVFRLHDLFDYNQGLEAERRRVAQAVLAATQGRGEAWQFLFPPPKGECFHGTESPTGTLFKFFAGSLFEHAVDQPRFLGGDSIAKQEGLVGECIALTQHLVSDASRGPRVAAALTKLVEQELSAGAAPRGARFWNLPNETLREVGS